MTSLRRSTRPLLAALLLPLLGQGPLCELTCAPTVAASSMAAAHEAKPPCHAAEPAPDPSKPAHPEHDCTSCDQVAAGSAFTAKPAAVAAFHAGATAISWITARPTAAVSFMPRDDRAPPGHSGRSLLLQKSSLLL